MKNILRCFILIQILLFFSVAETKAQSQSAQKKNIIQVAHDKSLKLEEFTTSDNEKFKLKIFTVDKAQTDKTHHWFIQLLSKDNQYINLAKINLNGFLKNQPDIKFNFFNPVNRMCNEGKYVIGFVKVKKAGIYVLNLDIENFGVKDTITLEIEIPDKPS